MLKHVAITIVTWTSGTATSVSSSNIKTVQHQIVQHPLVQHWNSATLDTEISNTVTLISATWK